MRMIGKHVLMSSVVKDMEEVAARGIYNGRMNETGHYLNTCRWYLLKYNAIVIYTHDKGMHDCGWWKNPDYNECMHASISFKNLIGDPRPKNNKFTKEILNFIFRENKRLLWCEPPYSEQGEIFDIWHYRLFIKNGMPTMPRGEVYTKKFTDAGWKSFSELHGTNKKMGDHWLPEVRTK